MAAVSRTSASAAVTEDTTHHFLPAWQRPACCAMGLSDRPQTGLERNSAFDPAVPPRRKRRLRRPAPAASAPLRCGCEATADTARVSVSGTEALCAWAEAEYI